MRCHERVESPHLEGTVSESENIAHELRVHGAHECLIHCEHAAVAAGSEIEPERFFVDDGVQAGIVEVLVQDVHLAQGLVAEARTLRGDSSEHAASHVGAFDSRSCSRTRRRLTHRVEDERRTTATTGVDGLAADQPLVLEHPQMVACGVQRHPAFLRERAGVPAGRLLDGAEQAETTRLGQTSIVMGTTGHGARISTLAGERTRFGRK